jgi:hypothetical protein
VTKRTLESLEGVVWPPPDFHSHLVNTVHRLRKKPIDEFTTEELRIVIGQGEGFKYLLPLALDILEADPLAEGDFYPGDLFVAVARNKNWLGKHREFDNRFHKLALS